MAYLVTCTDKKNSLDLRLSTREEHIKYLMEIKDMLILAGPILDKNNKPCGTVLVLGYEDLNEVKSFLENDPYSKARLFQKIEITRFKKVL